MHCSRTFFEFGTRHQRIRDIFARRLRRWRAIAYR